MVKKKKQKGQKVFHKKKIQISVQIENKNHLQKNEIDVDILKVDQREFIENDKLILKTQQRFKSESQNAFIEEINKIALSSNDDKRMQSTDTKETYAYKINKY